MSAAQLAVMDTGSNRTLAERLIDQLADRIGGLGVELADIAGNVQEVVTHVKEVHKQGMGVISMKLAGEGTFDREDRRKAMRFAFQNAGVDCVTVGYKAPAEIDEAIENLNLALA